MRSLILSKQRINAVNISANINNGQEAREVITSKNRRKFKLNSNINNKTGGSQYGKKQRAL